MDAKECERIEIKIYMAGDINTARRVIRAFCFERGWCVTVTPTTFIYSGGEETGFIVGVENYPRFPTTLKDLTDKAEKLAVRLAECLYEKSYMICTPDLASWITRTMPFEEGD